MPIIHTLQTLLLYYYVKSSGSIRKKFNKTFINYPLQKPELLTIEGYYGF